MAELRYFSHSRCDADETCQRKRYLSREWGGTGLDAIQDGFDLVFGNLIHQGLDALAKTGSIDYDKVRKDVFTEALKVFTAPIAQDWATLGEGLLRGFVRKIWPLWMAEYEVFDSERWIEYDCGDGFIFRARQDLLLKNKFDGSISYREYKTTSSNKPEWIASWARSTQVHSAMFVLREAQGITPRDCVVQGLYKGYKDKKLGGQRSPMTWGWVNREFAFSPSYSYDYTRSKGWEGFDTFSEFEDLGEWVANMPHTAILDQYPCTAPIFPRDDIANTWFRQQMIREREVAEAVYKLGVSTNIDEVTTILDTHFKQSFSKCMPAWGYKCEFEPYCWRPHVEADPLGSGLFKRHEEI